MTFFPGDAAPWDLDTLLSNRLYLPTRRPLKIGAAGDSIADFFMGDASSNGSTSSRYGTNTPLSWALFTSQADVIVDGRSYANGGYNFGIGGSPSSSLISTQLAQVQQRPPDILFVQTFQNDSILAYTDVATFAPNAEQFATGALAAGVKLVVILSCPPHNTRSGATRAKALAALNLRLERFARSTPGVIYVDTISKLLDPTYATAGALVPYKGVGAPTAWGSYSSDGVHFTGLGAKSHAPEIADLLASVARKRLPRMGPYDAKFDATNNPYGSVWGNSGLFVGTAGTYNGTAAGLNVASNWTVSDNNGIVVTPSLVTDPDGYIAQRLTLSGIATAAATITLALSGGPTFISPAPGPGQFNIEAMIGLNALANVSSVSLDTTSSGISAAASICPGISAVTQRGLLASRRGANLGSGTSFGAGLVLSIPNGATASGSIDISRFGCFRDS